MNITHEDSKNAKFFQKVRQDVSAMTFFGPKSWQTKNIVHSPFLSFGLKPIYI